MSEIVSMPSIIFTRLPERLSHFRFIRWCTSPSFFANGFHRRRRTRINEREFEENLSFYETEDFPAVSRPKSKLRFESDTGEVCTRETRRSVRHASPGRQRSARRDAARVKRLDRARHDTRHATHAKPQHDRSSRHAARAGVSRELQYYGSSRTSPGRCRAASGCRHGCCGR